MAKESKDELGLKQFHIQTEAKSALSSAGFARTPYNAACLKVVNVLQTCLHADSHCK